LSPLLFDIAIDPLQQLLRIATDLGFLRKVLGRGPNLRTSLYADDVVIFLKPILANVDMLASILGNFGRATGLVTNLLKSSVVPIRCAGINIDMVLGNFHAVRTTFPLRYLGLPLSVYCLRRADFQFLEDKIAAKLPTHLGKHLTAAGRCTWIKSVSTSQAIYPLTPLHVPPPTLKAIANLQRAFFWAGSSSVSGGKCKVNWKTVCRPKELGGLGIINLEIFARALRLRWPWQEWTMPEKLWVGLGNPCTPVDMSLFYAATSISIGNGASADFWQTPWLLGQRPMDIAPDIYALCRRKNWKVVEALHNGAWVDRIDFSAGLSVHLLEQFVSLWDQIQRIILVPGQHDGLTWRLSASGCYSTKSAYLLQFLGATYTNMETLVWNAWAPPKYKLFAWLVIQNRVWTADRLQRRGWPNCGVCPLCRQSQESAVHLLFLCRFSSCVWREISAWVGLPQLLPAFWLGMATVKNCWTASVTHEGAPRRAMVSILTLVAWKIWNERNARVFRQRFSRPAAIIRDIKEEAALWVLAGAKRMANIIPGE
jgi:hypothetical protein